MKQRKKTILDKYITATNTHDFSNLVSIIHSNAQFTFTDKICKGLSEIQAYFEAAWESLKDEKYWAENIQEIYTGPDTKVYTYYYCYNGYSNGVLTEGKGKATNIFIREDGNWKLVHEHLSQF